MRTLVNRAIALCATCVALTALQAHADGDEAEDSTTSFEESWVAGFAVTSGFTIQEQRSTVDSANLLDPTGEFRGGDKGKDWAVSPYVGVSAEVMSPAFEWLPRNARLFISADVLPTFSADRDIATEGNAAGFEIPEDRQGRDLVLYTANSIQGQGNKISSELRTGVYAFNVGMAFPFEVRGYRMRAKPSFGWIWYEVEVKGLLLDADKPLDFDPTTRFVGLENRQKQGFQGIGPGLEIELDVVRYGDFLTSLFIDGHAYRILGDRSIDMSDAEYFDDAIGTALYTADWTFDVEPWMYRAGLGLRVRWLGW
jgi:hypothetical protein